LNVKEDCLGRLAGGEGDRRGYWRDEEDRSIVHICI
jgi:hypothetical protein